jgi:Ni/Co efflux regulator RcnB
MMKKLLALLALVGLFVGTAAVEAGGYMSKKSSAHSMKTERPTLKKLKHSTTHKNKVKKYSHKKKKAENMKGKKKSWY